MGISLQGCLPVDEFSLWDAETYLTDTGVVTGLFLANENTIEPAIDLLALVLREASRDRSLEG